MQLFSATIWTRVDSSIELTVTKSPDNGFVVIECSKL